MKPTSPAAPSTPPSPAELRRRLLDAADLGDGYTREPGRGSSNDDVTMIGCPALEKLGTDAAAGGSLGFPRRAEASFTYTGRAGAEVSEELYSDTEAELGQAGPGLIAAPMPESWIHRILTVRVLSAFLDSAKALGGPGEQPAERPESDVVGGPAAR